MKLWKHLITKKCSIFEASSNIYFSRNLVLLQKRLIFTTKHCLTTSNFLKDKNILVVSKMSRYEYEKFRYKGLPETEICEKLKQRGSDIETLIQRHTLHKSFEENFLKVLTKLNIRHKVVNRLFLNAENVDWADVIVPVGGDGTFLMAASHVWGSCKPVIGFNSDPNISEGYLCLPKKYSLDVENAVDHLMQGKFCWKFRSRIRVSLIGDKIFDDPVALYEQELCLVNPSVVSSMTKNTKLVERVGHNLYKRILPFLALNEVFLGEKLAARVSYFEVMLDGGISTKIKSSGFCVCTGTGSSSWHRSINCISAQDVCDIFVVMNQPIPKLPEAQAIAKKFNDNLIFDPEDSRLSYSVREIIDAGVWPRPKGITQRGFIKRLEVRSRCFDAALVIDGGVSIAFNDGALACLEILEEDRLRTVVLTD